MNVRQPIVEPIRHLEAIGDVTGIKRQTKVSRTREMKRRCRVCDGMY